MKRPAKVREFEYNGLNVRMAKGFNCWRAMIGRKSPAFIIAGQNFSAAQIKVEKMIDNGDYARFQFPTRTK